MENLHLVGVAEIRRMLGITRQRVNQLVAGPDWPRPVATLEAGRIWRVEDIEAWIASTNRPPAERVQGMPLSVMKALVVGFTAHEADFAVTEIARTGRLFHVGDPMGKVLAWLWREQPSAAMEALAHYLEELREHHPQAPDPKISLEDVLRALGPAMPPDFRGEEYEALCAAARDEVPGLYGGGLS